MRFGLLIEIIRIVQLGRNAKKVAYGDDDQGDNYGAGDPGGVIYFPHYSSPSSLSVSASAAGGSSGSGDVMVSSGRYRSLSATPFTSTLPVKWYSVAGKPSSSPSSSMKSTQAYWNASTLSIASIQSATSGRIWVYPSNWMNEYDSASNGCRAASIPSTAPGFWT